MCPNYAMVPINTKEDNDGIHVRRVLVSYENSEPDENYPELNFTNLSGTRLVDMDPYFSNPTSSHKYTFEDAGYRLNEADNVYGRMYDSSMPEIYNLRQYHIFNPYHGLIISRNAPTYVFDSYHNRIIKHDEPNQRYSVGDSLSAYFTAPSDEAAIRIFRERAELK